MTTLSALALATVQGGGRRNQSMPGGVSWNGGFTRVEDRFRTRFLSNLGRYLR
jgi:hypothetical protein